MKTTPTQVKYPNRAAIRSLVQGLLAWLTVVPLLISLVIEETEKAGLELPEKAKVYLILLSSLAGIVTAVFARLMASPKVEAALQKTPIFNKLAAMPAKEEG